MPNSNGAFTLTINTTAQFGETTKPQSENGEIAFVLRQVLQDVASGRPSRTIVDRAGNSVCTYSYGAGMSNAGR